MPPKKTRSKGLTTSRSTKKSAGPRKTLPQAPTTGALRRGQLSKAVDRSKEAEDTGTTTLSGPRKHTRRAQCSPLREQIDDIDRLIHKGKQKPKKSSLTARAAPHRDAHPEYQEPGTLPSYLVPIPSIETDPDAILNGGATEQDRYDQQAEETPESAPLERAPWLDLGSPDTDEHFLLHSGYIDPWSNEFLASVHWVLGPEAAITMASINASDHRFANTLRVDRNVLMDETPQNDSQLEHVQNYEFRGQEDDGLVTSYLDKLWRADLVFCRGQQETIFQRTVMMTFINRHQLIFSENTTPTESPPTESSKSPFMFSVEAVWECPPMPTRRYPKTEAEHKAGTKIFTTRPKPDLCVSFYRRRLISDGKWNALPPETRQLVCYEGLGDRNDSRAFGFLFVEAKRSRYHPEDEEALNQALNDASQALHNMYEFFNEAGEASAFFKCVRVFTVTASVKGVIFRVHWARRLPEDEDIEFGGRIVPDYPLQFRFQKYASFESENFDRSKVVETFERIMKGYGEKQLFHLLQRVAAGLKIGRAHGINDYRHGQKRLASSTCTPALLPARGGTLA